MPDFTATRLFTYINGTIIDPGENNPNENEIYNKHNASMDGITGHTHSGTVGDGPILSIGPGTGINLAANYPWTGTHSFSQPITGNVTLSTGNLAVSGGNLVVSGGFLQVISNDIILSDGRKIFFDAGNNNYISLDAPDKITVYIDGNSAFTFGNADLVINGGRNLELQAGTKLAFDGTTQQNYLTLDAADKVSVYIDNTQAYTFGNNEFVVQGGRSIFLQTGSKLYFDNGGNDYITGVAANHVKITVGGTDRVDYEADGTEGHSGQMLLPSADPPLANYMNRNSSLKGAWRGSTTTPSTVASYNVSSISKNGTGDIDVNWNTDFGASTSSIPVVSPLNGAPNNAIAEIFSTNASTTRIQRHIIIVGTSPTDIDPSDGTMYLHVTGTQ